MSMQQMLNLYHALLHSSHFKPNQLAGFQLIKLNALLNEEKKIVCSLISLLQVQLTRF